MSELSMEDKKIYINKINDAMLKFCPSYVLPIYAYQGDNANPTGITIAGTGNLFFVNNKVILVTAAHVTDCINYNYQLGVCPKEGSQLIEVKKELIRKCSDGMDVSFAELSVYKDLFISRKFITIDEAIDIDNVPGINSSWIYVFGYPLETTKIYQSMRSIVSTPLGYGTTLFDGELSSFHSDFNKERNFLLSYSKSENFDSRNANITCPALFGISGCAVWLAYKSGDPIDDWTPEKARIIGIQTGFFSPQGALNCVSWSHILKFINNTLQPKV